MYLALKNGRLGRQIPGPNLEANIEPPALAARRTNVELSSASIAADDAYWRKKDQEAQARAWAIQARNKYENQARQQLEQKRRNKIEKHQSVVDLEQARLKKYFAKQMGKTESAKVLNSLEVRAAREYSADFDIDDFSVDKNPQQVRVPRAEFRQYEIMGNPLTRDGAWGPSTDFDRFVQGTELDNDIAVESHGTVLRKNVRESNGIGGFWDSITSVGDWFTNVGSQTFDQLKEELPGTLTDAALTELQQQITGPTQPTTVYVQQPATGYPSGYPYPAPAPAGFQPAAWAQQMGVPPWALYGVLGLLGVGIIFMGVKAVRG